MASHVHAQVKPPKSARKLVFLALVPFLFVCLALSPAVSPTASAMTGSLVDLGIIATSAVEGAALGGLIADGPGAAVGALVGSLFGFFLTYDGDDPTDMNNPKDYYAIEKAMDLRSLLNLSDAQAQNLAESFDAMVLFYARKAEFAAHALYDYQKNHSLSFTFDPEWIFRESQVYQGTQSQYWAVTQTYNEVLSSFDDLSSTYVGTYAGMKWGLYCEDSGNGYGVASSGTEPLAIRAFTQMNTTGTQKVIINPSYPLMLWKPLNYISNTYVLSLYDADGELAYTDTRTLADDAAVSVLNISGEIPIGAYHIDLTDGWKLNGLGVPAPTDSGACIPYLAIFKRASSSNETLLFQRAVCYDAAHAHWEYQSSNADGTTLPWGPKFLFTGAWSWTDSDGITNHTVQIVGNGAIPGILQQLSSLISKTTSMYSTVIAFGQTAYNLVKASGGRYAPPPADMIFADPIQMQNLTWQQIYLIYMAYMQQADSWYHNYSVMDTYDVNFSAESLKLVLRGELRDENNLIICDNSTVMTPYVSIYNMTLETSSWSYFNQPGFVIVWGNTSEATTGPSYGTGQHDPVTTDFNISNCKFIPVHAGWSIMPYEMIYDGEFNASVTLHVTTLNYVVGNVSDQGDNPPPQEAGDWQWILEHWYYIGFIAAGALLLAAVKGGWIVAIIGLIVLLASLIGYLYANWGDIFAWFNPFFSIRAQVSMWWWN